MRPDESNHRRVGKPLITQRPLLYARDATTPLQPQTHRDTSRDSAANVIRHQVDSIYNGNTSTPTPQTTPVATPAPAVDSPVHEVTLAPPPERRTSAPPVTAPTEEHTADNTAPEPAQTDAFETASPYERTHTRTPRPQADQWKQYHSAWQDYYRQYYERYYLSEIQKTQQQPETNQSLVSSTVTVASNEHAAHHEAETRATDESVSQNEALNELRQKIRSQVRESAQKVRKSRHFLPISAGILVLLLFSFLQYNRTFFAAVNAYVTPGSIDPQNIIVDPTVAVEVGPEPKLVIPKINVEAPVVYDTTPDNEAQMKAMESGVAHFAIPGANSVPGQVGNTVIAGHSSNDVFARGDYKFIFAQNEKLTEGDVIYMNYKGTRYTYRITSREVVMPTEVDKIVLDTNKPMLTLISCVPLGTADKRLLIFAEQVHPSPAGASAAPDTPASPQGSSIPGNAPTFLERVFGG